MTERKHILAEKILDLGNFTVVGLIFGQLLAEKKNVSILIFGILLFLFCWTVGFILLKKGGKKKHEH